MIKSRSLNPRPPFYKVGDKVETIRNDVGAWFSGDIIDIYPNSECQCQEVCSCTYKVLFEGNSDSSNVVERKLPEIRQVSYASLTWESLKPGMTVVINYNIDKPKTWGFWYDYVINEVSERNFVICVKGTLLSGYNGSLRKIAVEINSNEVADVLKIRHHTSLKEKESDGYETGVKPEYCKRCKNKPRITCRLCCCCKCGSKQDYNLTLLCDECGKWYHIFCLQPPLLALPKGDVDEDWYCPKCNNNNHRIKVDNRLNSRVKRQTRSCRKSSSPQKNGRNKRSYEDLEKVNSGENGKNEWIFEDLEKVNPDRYGKNRRIYEDPEKANKNAEKCSLKANCRKSTSPHKNGRNRWNDQDLEKMNKNIENASVKAQLQLTDDVEIQEITSDMSNSIGIWNEVKKLYPNYDIRIFVAIREKEDDDKELNSFIDKDTVNEHLWSEAKKSMSKGTKAYLEHVETLFTCSICCELMKDPITLSCKHSFCLACFIKSLGVNLYNCALCRTDVIHTQHYAVNHNLKMALSLLFDKSRARNDKK